MLRVPRRFAHRIFTVSNPWVTVTAPQAAMPPAMKDLIASPVSMHLKDPRMTADAPTRLLWTCSLLLRQPVLKVEKVGEARLFHSFLYRGCYRAVMDTRGESCPNRIKMQATTLTLYPFTKENVGSDDGSDYHYPVLGSEDGDSCQAL